MGISRLALFLVNHYSCVYWLYDNIYDNMIMTPLLVMVIDVDNSLRMGIIHGNITMGISWNIRMG